MVLLRKEEAQLVQILLKQIMEDSLKQEDGLMDNFQLQCKNNNRFKQQMLNMDKVLQLDKILKEIKEY